jgi:hypothetical protein
VVVTEAFSRPTPVVLLQQLAWAVVYPATIAARLAAELPFIASEDMLVEATARGGDRQVLHERIRRHAQAAARQVKQHGRPNDLIERLQGDPAFGRVKWARCWRPGGVCWAPRKHGSSWRHRTAAPEAACARGDARRECGCNASLRWPQRGGTGVPPVGATGKMPAAFAWE